MASLLVHALLGFSVIAWIVASNSKVFARPAGGPVHHQVGFSDRAVGGERILQIVFGGVEGKVSNKQFTTHVMFYCPD